MLTNVANHIDDIVGDIGKLISECEHAVGLEHLANEEDITSQFAGQLKNILNFSKAEFSVRSRAIVTKKTTEEPTLGADILVVFSFGSQEISISKGFLAQAKKIDAGKSIGGSQKMDILREQCRKMLDFSPESYVWLYSKERFRVQRAITAKAVTTNIPDDALSQSLQSFFHDFLISMRGDPSISLQNFSRLRRIIQELDIRYALFISATVVQERPSGGGVPSPDGGPPDLDSLVTKLGGAPVEVWFPRKSDTVGNQIFRKGVEAFEQKASPQQCVQKRRR